MTDEKATELLPCPLCKGEAELAEIIGKKLFHANNRESAFYSDMTKAVISALRPYLNDGSDKVQIADVVSRTASKNATLVIRVGMLEKALNAIAIQMTTDEVEDGEVGDIEHGYDSIILAARHALKSEETK